MTEIFRILPVRKLTDRISVRKEVREVASSLDFDTWKQARISMAVYYVINIMDMGLTCDGEVFINQVWDGILDGLQIFCKTDNNKNKEFTSTLFNDISWLVDDLKVEKISSSAACVTLLIWADN